MNYFDIEDAIQARLSSIAGLDVRLTADVSDTSLKATARPTAVITFAGDTATDSNRYAVQLEQRWAVYLLCRGPRKERQATDGVLLHSIISLLHGWQPTADAEPLALAGVEVDYVDNAREYLANFDTRVVFKAAS